MRLTGGAMLRACNDYSLWYRNLLREMKRRGLKVDDMPADVAESFLALHQRALLIEGRKRNHVKDVKREDERGHQGGRTKHTA